MLLCPVNCKYCREKPQNPTIQKAKEANKTKYVLSKDSERLVFQSEQEACEKLGVYKCSVAFCYWRGCKCKGYEIERIGAKMDLEE